MVAMSKMLKSAVVLTVVTGVAALNEGAATAISAETTEKPAVPAEVVDDRKGFRQRYAPTWCGGRAKPCAAAPKKDATTTPDEKKDDTTVADQKKDDTVPDVPADADADKNKDVEGEKEKEVAEPTKEIEETKDTEDKPCCGGHKSEEVIVDEETVTEENKKVDEETKEETPATDGEVHKVPETTPKEEKDDEKHKGNENTKGKDSTNDGKKGGLAPGLKWTLTGVFVAALGGGSFAAYRAYGSSAEDADDTDDEEV